MKITLPMLRREDAPDAAPLSAHLREMAGLLDRVSAGIDRQKALLSRMEGLIDDESASSAGALSSLVAGIDTVVEEVRAGGQRTMDGKYGRFSYTASLWFQTGWMMHQRRRIFIRTHTSAALGLRLPGGKFSREALRWACDEARSALDKSGADMRAYRLRLDLVGKHVRALAAAATDPRMGLLSSAKASVGIMKEIVDRIESCAARSAGKDYGERLFLQVEVSQLVDEVDRIASQTFFHSHLPLTGVFSRTNPRASLWFLSDRDPDGRRRLFMGTLTALALRLKSPQYGRTMVRVVDDTPEAPYDRGNAEENRAILRYAKEKVSAEIAQMEGHLRFFGSDRRGRKTAAVAPGGFPEVSPKPGRAP